MNSSLFQRLHWTATIVLGLLVLLEAFFLLTTTLDSNAYKTGRPQGITLTLDKDLPVFELGSSVPAFSLPKGTLIQASTPFGFSTLGKQYGFEYLLIIHSQKSLGDTFPDYSGPFTDGWYEHYSFTPNDDAFEFKPELVTHTTSLH